MKSKIDRKSRDRRGGHQSNLPSLRSSQNTPPSVRAFYKRQGVKLLRRQHNQAVQFGLAQMDQERRDFEEEYGQIQADLYDEQRSYLEYLNDMDYLDHRDCGFDPDTFDDRDYDCLSRMDNENYYPTREPHYDLDEVMVKNHDAGKSLGQLLREHMERRAEL